jgi:hypothetical protein
MPQERCVPHAIAWRGHNPYQALPEHLVQSYPSLNAHTVGYGPFWGNGIPEHLRDTVGLCGKGHYFVWSDAIQDAHFPWLSEGIRPNPATTSFTPVHH